MTVEEIFSLNRRAWDKRVEAGNRWTVPVGPEVIAAARARNPYILLTPSRPVPGSWFPDRLAGLAVLCLASGGGQQGPVLAAAGASVTVVDASPRQLARDREVAAREGLELTTLEGDMADLTTFPDCSFDLIVHPVSNNFAPELRPVWREAFRVLRPGGELLAGFANPVRYLFDETLLEQRGVLQVVHSLPYADVDHLTPGQQAELADAGQALEYSHTLEDQIGGQLEAGFVLTGFYEDGYEDPESDPLSAYLSTFVATRALRPFDPAREEQAIL